jgi:hypothetical protein
MTPRDVERACKRLDAGNVAAFCKRVGISRPSYYRALKGPVTELTAFKIKTAEERADEK